jgi:hypothetical protein
LPTVPFPGRATPIYRLKYQQFNDVDDIEDSSGKIIDTDTKKKLPADMAELQKLILEGSSRNVLIKL